MNRIQLSSSYFSCNQNFDPLKLCDHNIKSSPSDSDLLKLTISTLEHLNITGSNAFIETKKIKTLTKKSNSLEAFSKTNKLIKNTIYFPEHCQAKQWSEYVEQTILKLNIGENRLLNIGSNPIEHTLLLKVKRQSKNLFTFFLINTGLGVEDSYFHPKVTLYNNKSIKQLITPIDIKQSKITADLFKKIYANLNPEPNYKALSDYQAKKCIQKLYSTLYSSGKVIKLDYKKYRDFYSSPQFGDSCTSSAYKKLLKITTHRKAYKSLQLSEKIAHFHLLKHFYRESSTPTHKFMLKELAQKINKYIKKSPLNNSIEEINSLKKDLNSVNEIECDSAAFIKPYNTPYLASIFMDTPLKNNLKLNIPLYKIIYMTDESSLSYAIEFRVHNNRTYSTKINYAFYKLYLYAATNNDELFFKLFNSPLIQQFLKKTKRAVNKSIDPQVLTLFLQMISNTHNNLKIRQAYAKVYSLTLLVDFANWSLNYRSLSTSDLNTDIKKARSNYYTMKASQYMGLSNPWIQSIRQLENIQKSIRYID